MESKYNANVVQRLFELVEVARSSDDLPRAAILCIGDSEFGRHDERRSSGDPTAHAVALVISDAARSLRTRRLQGATIYATHEPCTMCAGALVASFVDRVVFIEAEPGHGAAGSLYNLLADPRLDHEVDVTIVRRPDEVLPSEPR